MRLEEEVAIYQFGQGVLSADDLLYRFAKLGEGDKAQQFFDLYQLVWDSKLTPADLEEAIVVSSMNAADPLCATLKNHWSKPVLKGVTIMHGLPESEPEKAYTLLLYLFKKGYQPRNESDKIDNDDWRYWDLSKPVVVQDILYTHQRVVEEVYNDPDFRSEFASLAKLWHANQLSMETEEFQEPDPRQFDLTTFLGYDELVTASLAPWLDGGGNKNSKDTSLLSHSLSNALSVKYGLDSEKAMKIVWEVVERHLRETYNTGLF